MPQKNPVVIYSDELLKQAVNVALYYGFLPTHRVREEVAKLSTPRGEEKKIFVQKSSLDPWSAELHAALRIYSENNFEHLSKPVLFYTSNIEHTKRLDKDEPVFLGFQAIGTGKSIAEALVIKAALESLTDMNVKDICIHINTIGDKDSVVRYGRELQNYFRKYMSDVPAPAQGILRRDVFQCLRYLHKKQHGLYDNAPQSMEFLSEASRRHLREMLEYLETIDVPYVIDKSLVGGNDYRPETLFEIRSLNTEDYDPTKNADPYVYARGARYDDLARKMFHATIPAAGIIIEAKRRGKNHASILYPKRVRQPKVYFIQFGFDAKLKSLSVIETLRRARVPIFQSLANDRLTHQLEHAEKLSIPYTIIMGQKEVLDNTVIVRNMDTRSQEIVPIDILPNFLKSIRL